MVCVWDLVPSSGQRHSACTKLLNRFSAVQLRQRHQIPIFVSHDTLKTSAHINALVLFQDSLCFIVESRMG